MASPTVSVARRGALAASCGAVSPAISATMRPGSWRARFWRSRISGSWEHRDDPARYRAVPAAGRVPAAADTPQTIQPHGGVGDLDCGVHRLAGSADAVLVSVPVGSHLFDRSSVDQLSADPLPRGAGGAEPVAGAAVYTVDAHRGAGVVELHRQAGEGVLRVPAVARIWRDRRIRGDGPLPVLRVL